MSATRVFANVIEGRLDDRGGRHPVIDPATEQVIAEVAIADAATLDRAVDCAERAFTSWSRTPRHDRARALNAVADALENDIEIAALLTAEVGKPIAEAAQEVGTSAMLLRHFAAGDAGPEMLERGAGGHVERFFTPLGVVAGITPWNFPILTAVMKLGPALITGNALLLKPSPTAPLASLHLGRMAIDHVPPGVFQVLADDGGIGPGLVAHPGIRKIAFTGSTFSGRSVMAASAPALKRLTLELGGNDPAIILPDCALEPTVDAIFGVAFANAGQICTAVKRVYVHADIHDRFCDMLAERVAQIRMGRGADAGVTMGPVQNRSQYEKLGRLSEGARREGRIVAQGSAPPGPGFFIAPAVVADLDDAAPLVAEEQFGPLLPVLAFTDEEEAISRANAGPYGLTASIWSADTERARRIARRIDAGTIWINKHLDLNPLYPMSFSKQSGIGVEFGRDGLLEYCQSHLLSQ